MIEGMQNSSWMTQMDEILKLIGSEEAAKHFNVQFFLLQIFVCLCYHMVMNV